MKSFRTELENPVIEKDILELEKKIQLFRNGEIDEDRFRSLRLARGVYGQRQEGVQMIRIKIPYGRLSVAKLRKICDVSQEYSRGNLHITTRQDIQIHYVKLDRTPELWAELEKEEVTMREACGNTVRNVTGSPMAGIDKEEPFDVTPYVDAFFKYFLRNPICQDMGRKFKVSFSSSDADDCLSYMHDLGFIPKIKDGERGFKVMLAGGLGSQPRLADVAFEFLPVDQIVPYAEKVLRVFDRYGERSRRNKARMKFLLSEIGMEEFTKLAEDQSVALKNNSYPIQDILPFALNHGKFTKEIQAAPNTEKYKIWLESNIFEQKQKGYFAVGLKIKTGDISIEKARKLAEIIEEYAADDFRLTVNQGIILRYVKEAYLPNVFLALDELGLANAGFDTLFDIIACPGTDTCNLGIASSMGLAKELERMLEEEYKQLVNNRDIHIKISGCMNACGQHTIANIGFQGMTVKSGKLIAPASQVLLGGGTLGNGEGRYADKVLKVPSKRSPECLRMLLNDFAANSQTEEKFNDYYDRMGSTYFYDMLKHLSDVESLTQEDFLDWGESEEYVKAIGVGECAGVMIDLVATLLAEAKDAAQNAGQVLESGNFADAIYHAYNSMIYGAKALLTSEKGAKMNTQFLIVKSFDELFIENKRIELPEGLTFSKLVYQINKNEPSQSFAESYIKQANYFVEQLISYRGKIVKEDA